MDPSSEIQDFRSPAQSVLRVVIKRFQSAPQTKRANGFKKWWVAGHASSHPLRGDLPITANVVERQNAIQPLAEEVISEIGMVSSSVRM